MSSRPCQHQLQGPTTLPLIRSVLARGRSLPSAVKSTARVTGLDSFHNHDTQNKLLYLPLPITGSIDSVCTQQFIPGQMADLSEFVARIARLNRFRNHDVHDVLI